MCDRYLDSLDDAAREPVLAGNVHDADSGPEGPPQHTSGGMTAGERD
jgi:hypothetical protein